MVMRLGWLACQTLMSTVPCSGVRTAAVCFKCGSFKLLLRQGTARVPGMRGVSISPGFRGAGNGIGRLMPW